jgi:hypothetical protein
MGSAALPLAAGRMTELLTLQTLSEVVSGDVVTPTWSDYAKVWAQPGPIEFVQQLPGEQSAPRQKGVFFVRRPTTPLPFPLKIINRGRTMLSIGAIDDLVAQDRTALHWVDGIDLTVGASNGSVEAATIARATQTVQPDKSSISTWSNVATGVSVLLEDADATLLERTFGIEVDATLRGTVDIASDVRLGDGVTITAGRHTGQKFLVAARRIDPTLPGQAYWSLALSRTTEALT